MAVGDRRDAWRFVARSAFGQGEVKVDLRDLYETVDHAIVLNEKQDGYKVLLGIEGVPPYIVLLESPAAKALAALDTRCAAADGLLRRRQSAFSVCLV